MGSGARGKRVRLDRSSQPPESNSDVPDKSSCSDWESSFLESMAPRFGIIKSALRPNRNPRSDNDTLDHYTDQQLNDFLLTELDLIYNDVITKFVAMGHHEGNVIGALLRNGHIHGDMDLLANIMHNTQLYLSTGASGCENTLVNANKVFATLVQLTEASLVTLLCLFRLSNPCLSRREAMWWLLMNDLRVVRFSSMKISDADAVTTQMDNELPISSDLAPFMAILLKDNADFSAAECRRLERAINQADGDTLSAVDKYITVGDDVVSALNQKGTKLILEKFHDKNVVDDNDEMHFSLMNEIKDLDVKVKERKDWADEKAVKAARTLCYERNDLKKIRMEREKDNERIKQQKSTLEVDHPTMKSLRDVEIQLSESNGQAYRAQLILARVEAENMEIKADIEASKLGTSESVTKISEAAKKEKKHMKKILASVKQQDKLEEEVSSEKEKLINMEEEMIQLEAAKRTAEAKWREEEESKEHAVARITQERRLKKETKENNKQIQDSLRTKVDLDFRRHKAVIQRLKQEVSWAKSLGDPDHNSTSLCGTHFDDDAIGKLLHGSGDDESDDEIDHECVMCAGDESCVVFLPCEHQVVCGGCNQKSVMIGDDKCAACGVLIEERIRVFCEGGC